MVPVYTSSVRTQRLPVGDRPSIGLPERTLDLFLELVEVLEEKLPATSPRKRVHLKVEENEHGSGREATKLDR